MKTQTLLNRFSVLSILTLFSLAVFLVVDAQPRDSSAAIGLQSAKAYDNAGNESVAAQIESVFSTSARHIFDEGYWIANMHNIKSF
jgi:hypothetical protein